MEPFSFAAIAMTLLISNAILGGRVGTALASMPSAAAGALRALWNGGGSTGSRGGSTSGARGGGRGGPGRPGKGKGRGSMAVKSPAVESSTWGHVRGGFADGWDRGWAKSRGRRRARWDRVRGWWRDRQEKRQEQGHLPWKDRDGRLQSAWSDLTCGARLLAGLDPRSPLPWKQRWAEVKTDIGTWTEPAQTGCCGCGRRTVDFEDPESGEQYCRRCRRGVDRYCRRRGRDPVQWRELPPDERNVPYPPDDPNGGRPAGLEPEPDGDSPSPTPTPQIPTQTPPAGPVSGEPPKEGTRMASDLTAPKIVDFWKKLADEASTHVEGERSGDLYVEGGSDLASALQAHAKQVEGEFSPMVEGARGSSHKYAAAYQE